MNVLVLMSSYNGEKYIEQQIKSILEQKTQNEIRIRIRDDGSTDSTRSVIEKLQMQYPDKIELVCGENIGYNASFFELLNSAGGFDYYAISDQDDVWLADKIDVAVKRLNNQNGELPLLYASTSYLANEDLEIYGKTRKKERPFNFYNTIIQNICPGHTQVMNNALLKKVQGDINTREIYVYDAWITNIAMLYGKILFENEAHTYYRQHKNNQMGSGTGRLGQLRASVRRSQKGEGKAYRKQIEYFVMLHEEEIRRQELYDEMRCFLNAKNIGQKMKYVLACRLHRQNRMETIAFRIAVLFGKY